MAGLAQIADTGVSVTKEVSLDDLDAWAEEMIEERDDVLRITALIRQVHKLAGFKF